MQKIWEEFESRMRSFIFSKVKDREVTEDLLQELFLKIHAGIDTVKDREKIQSWIYQVCRNLVTDHFRKTGKEPVVDRVREEVAEDDSDSEYMSEALNDMIKMMSEMPPAYCEALCLTELEGMSQKAYAEQAGISYSGAKTRVQRARVMLKDMLMRCCHYEFDKYGTIVGIHPVKCCCCN